jgi:hypothetical protein
MNTQQLVDAFLSSSHGQQAIGALGQQGFGAEEAISVLQHTVSTASDHVNAHAESGGLLGQHPGKSFFAAFAAGLLHGDGVLGALKDGAEGLIVAKVTEVLASKAGYDAGRASTLAAAATPYAIAFLKQHLGQR